MPDRETERDSDEWQPVHCWWPRRLVDGTFGRGRLMRRWTGRRWEYRRKTAAERLDDL